MAAEATANWEKLYPLVVERLNNPSGNEYKHVDGTDRNGNIWAFCPAHPDGSKSGRRSLSVHRHKGLYCHAGCSYPSIMAAFHLDRDSEERAHDIAAEQPKRDVWQPQGAPQVAYDYCDERGNLVAQKARWEKDGQKTFRWRVSPDRPWGSLEGKKETDLPLYRAELIANAKPEEVIYFVEGEKAADALTKNGFYATTLATGAGAKEYGKSLEVLRGKNVALWPDNDAVGREHMIRVGTALKGIAAKMWFVAVPRQLPPKGDAADFFKEGGTAEELRNGVFHGVRYTYTELGGVRIVHPTFGTPVEFQFDSIEVNRREVNAEMVVSLPNEEPYSQRINVLSRSAVNELENILTKLYGEKPDKPGGRYRDIHGWPRVLSTVFATLRSALSKQERAMDALDIPEPVGDPFFCNPFLPLDQPTTAFGDGSSGKSLWAMALALHAACGAGSFCGAKLPDVPAGYVDYEDSPGNWARRVRRLCTGLGLELQRGRLSRYNPKDMPIADQIDALQSWVLNMGIRLLIVDSAAPACGSQPEGTEETNRYFNAIAKLGDMGVTVLTIAHISKGKDGRKPDTYKPFGNSYWHHRSRRTWYVKREQETDSDEIDVGFLCRKVNDGPRPHDRAFHFSFTPNYGPITIRGADISRTRSLNEERSPQDQLYDLLEHGAMPVKDIADQLGGSQDKWERILKAHSHKMFVPVHHESSGGRPARWWGRLERARPAPHTEQQEAETYPHDAPEDSEKSNFELPF